MTDTSTMPINSDDRLSAHHVALKHQLHFTKYFGPKYAYGLVSAEYDSSDDSMHVVARIKPVHQSTKGKTTAFKVPMSKFNVWRKNVKLYEFIS